MPYEIPPLNLRLKEKALLNWLSHSIILQLQYCAYFPMSDWFWLFLVELYGARLTHPVRTKRQHSFPMSLGLKSESLVRVRREPLRYTSFVRCEG